MTKEDRNEITRISQEFTHGFRDMFESINGTGWLIVDPLSGYLDFCGYKNKLHELPATGNTPQVMVIIFEDGSQFIPAGGDLINAISNAENWMWI